MSLKMCNIHSQKGFCCSEDVNNLKLILIILGVKIMIVNPKWTFKGPNLIKIFKNSDFDPKIVKTVFLNICIITAAKTMPVTFQTPLLAPIIAHLQRHNQLYFPISLIFNVFFKYFKNFVDFDHFYSIIS